MNDYTVIQLQEPDDLRDRAALAAKRQKKYEQEAESIWADLAIGAIGLATWQRMMQNALKRYHLTMALIALGGDILLLSEETLDLVEAELARQGGYLDNFARAVVEYNDAKGELPKTGATRAKMYGGAGRATFWRNITPWAAKLPAHPGDFSTRCGASCACKWLVEMGLERGTWLCTWVIDETKENCPDCLQRADEWSPYVLYSRIPPITFEILPWEGTQ